MCHLFEKASEYAASSRLRGIAGESALLARLAFQNGSICCLAKFFRQMPSIDFGLTRASVLNVSEPLVQKKDS